MGVKRVAAAYVYTLESSQPIRNGFVEYDDADGISQLTTNSPVQPENALLPNEVTPSPIVTLVRLLQS